MSSSAKILLNTLRDKNILKSLNSSTHFHDEPQFYSFSCELKTDVSNKVKKITGNGFSFLSKKIAVLKCLAEAIERYSLYNHTEKKLLSLPLKKNVFYFNDYGYKDVDYQSIKKWVKGIDLINNRDIYIPANLVYLSYINKLELQIYENTSSGTAFGFDKTSTLLRGIYEIVERDACMTMYLTQLPPKKIDIKSIKNSTIQKIVRYINRYNVKVDIFDITNDLLIPSFMTCLTDTTGIGPAITIGSKSSLNIMDAILGSMEEACMLRPGIRYQRTKNSQKNVRLKIMTALERANFWYEKRNMKYLNFFLKQTSIKINYNTAFSSEEKQLALILDVLRKKDMNLYYADITHPLFAKNKLYIYKVFIPQLQPFYLDELKQKINTNRIKTFLNYHNIHEFTLNSIPHPFL